MDPSPNISTCKIAEYLEIQSDNPIGQGAYGCVYRAKNVKSGEQVMVKMLLLGNQPKGVSSKYIFREISGWKSISHPNICPFRRSYCYQEPVAQGTQISQKIWFIVESEDCGESLAHYYCRKGRLSENEVRLIAHQVVQALVYLHQNQFFHRDIKECNILIDSKGVVRLCDFGFLRRLDLTMSEYTVEVGTYGYQSPEQALARKVYSCQIDMWALGVVIMNLILGENRFACKSQSEMIIKLVEHFGVERLNELDLSSEEQAKVYICGVRKYYLEEVLAGKMSPTGMDFLMKLLEVSPLQRMEAKTALEHEWFKQ